MVSSRSFGQLPPRLYKLASELALLSRILLTSTLELLSRSALPCTARAATFCLLLNRTPPSTPASTLTSHGSTPRSDFKKEAVEGISFYLNGICYEALEDLRERIEMDFIHNQGTYLRQEAYGQPMTDRVPVGSKNLLTKIKALYDNTPKHPGEGTSSKNIHVQISQMHHGEGSSSRNIHGQTSHMLCHDYQSTSRLAALPDKLSLREDHNDAIMQQLSDVPPDERTLFVTFSNGYPLTKDELYEFFMSHYEDIEEINIEVPFEDRPPLYAHVTFHSQLTLFRVLDGNIRVNFMTCSGKHIWARRFVRRRRNKLKCDDLYMPSIRRHTRIESAAKIILSLRTLITHL
ncbi:hypothetical protein ZWY2020_037492 [Hordeum vulgare]|nr:hypothetical protein ZWY2020_037492 [Hordeum vulgare]